jgi:hypothetical protein
MAKKNYWGFRVLGSWGEILFFSPNPLISPSLHQHYQPDGGLLFGGGGFFIPRRKYSPVSFRFQLTEIFWFNGCAMVIAPGLGHSSIQAAQNQHSSGYRTMGGFFFSGFGIMTSVGHTSTQRLQPLHISGLNFCPLLGVMGLGVIYTLSFMSGLLSW